MCGAWYVFKMWSSAHKPFVGAVLLEVEETQLES